jgi:hypothetical protein
MKAVSGGGTVAAPEVLTAPMLEPGPDGAAGGVGDWTMSAAARSGRVGAWWTGKRSWGERAL